ncbi:MAG: tyrosinase family protein [Saprospiraceae bacterium]|nr:tyrosinase family protein [Saprospiraceae bacterium]
MKTLLCSFMMVLIFTTGFSQKPDYKRTNTSKQYVRKNATSPSAKADLDAMADAFEIMRSMRCDAGRSWYYQGAIHNIPAKIIGANKLCALYETEKDKLFAWGDCTHAVKTDTLAKEKAALHFLLWHRLYTWHLEKIVRKLSCKEDFAIPFWNYGSDIVDENRLPSQLQDPTNALYEQSRYSLLNNGYPIDDSTRMDIGLQLNSLATTTPFGGETGFSQILEASPHGLMHDYIGADGKEILWNEIYQDSMSGLMANVPSAGFDPVFWLHHSMVDRIWWEWDNSEYGSRPTLEELKEYPWEYNFIEPNGDEITYSLEEVYAIVFDPDYTYEDVEEPQILTEVQSPSMPTSLKDAFASTKKMKKSVQQGGEILLWKHGFNRVIGNKPFKHLVSKDNAKKTIKHFKKAQPSKLVLRINVVVYKEPGHYFTVFLRYKDQPDKYLGMMTFFGVNHHHGVQHHHSLGEEGAKLSFAYEISDDLVDTNDEFEIIINKRGDSKAKVTVETMSLSAIN